MASAPCTPVSPTMPDLFPPENASASSSVASASAVANNEGASQQRRERRVLPKAATAILQHCYQHVSTNPDLAERTRLLHEIQQIPGAEWYSSSHVYGYFKYKRTADKHEATQLETGKKRRRRAVEKTTTPDNILWPSLTKQSIEALKILVQDTPNPSQKHLEIWSQRLSATVQDVTYWIELKGGQTRTPELQNEDRAVDDRPVLPTPEATASPEPRYRKIPASSAPSAPAPLYSQAYSEFATPLFSSMGAASLSVYPQVPTVAVRPVPNTYYTPVSPPSVPPQPKDATPAVLTPQLSPFMSPLSLNQPSRVSSPVTQRGTPTVEQIPPAFTGEKSVKEVKPRRFASPIVATGLPTSVPQRKSTTASQLKMEPISPVQVTVQPPAVAVAKRTPPPIPRINIFRRSTASLELVAGPSSQVMTAPSGTPTALQPIIPTSPQVLDSSPFERNVPVASTPPLPQPSRQQSAEVSVPTTHSQDLSRGRNRLDGLRRHIEARRAEDQLSPPSPPPSDLDDVTRCLSDRMQFYNNIIKGTYSLVGLVPIPLSDDMDDEDSGSDMDVDP